MNAKIPSLYEKVDSKSQIKNTKKMYQKYQKNVSKSQKKFNHRNCGKIPIAIMVMGIIRNTGFINEFGSAALGDLGLGE